jgi:hypothetical protein
MSESKFTPKWTYCHDGHGAYSIETDDLDRRQICYVKNKDHANLIAAAPEMFEALEAIIAACDRCEQIEKASLIDEFTEEIEQAARAAFAKAKGEQS